MRPLLKALRIAVWRRRIGAVSAALGCLLLAVVCFIYLRYASDPMNLHVQERLQHARLIGLFWNASFYGAVVLFLLSLFGIGWSRWVGLIVNSGTFLCGLMTMGALCGPFGC
jgi:hypothetical protein